MKRRLVASSSAGYTLLELLAVLTLMALTLAFVAPNLARSDGTDLRSASNVIASGLRRARSRAIAANEATFAVFDLRNREFVVSGMQRPFELPPQLNLELVAASALSIDNEVAAIEFYPDGSSSGGRILLRATTGAVAVDVNWFTGQVRVHDTTAVGT